MLNKAAINDNNGQPADDSGALCRGKNARLCRPCKGLRQIKARVFGSAAPAGNTADESLRLSAAGIRRTITDAAEDGRTPQSPAKAGLPDNTT